MSEERIQALLRERESIMQKKAEIHGSIKLLKAKQIVEFSQLRKAQLLQHTHELEQINADLVAIKNELRAASDDKSETFNDLLIKHLLTGANLCEDGTVKHALEAVAFAIGEARDEHRASRKK
jgi:hypothetical protein